MGVAVSQQTYPPQLQGLTVHNFEENKERQRHYGDAKLGIRLPNLQTVSQFGVAGLNAATSSSNLLLKTEAGCCVKKERIPWAWHDFCRALHDPVNHGRLFRHLALISAVDPDRMKTQFESEAKEGSLYFKLERKGGGLANFCVAVVRDINLARKLIPMELVPYARKLVAQWSRHDIGVFVFFMGWKCGDEEYWRKRAHDLPSTLDGKKLLGFATTVAQAERNIINIFTRPGHSEPLGYREGQRGIIQRAARELGFAENNSEIRSRILANCVLKFHLRTLNYLSSTRDQFISK
mmetsp:Transcript_20546/g.50417  ORF Transcript_20546/g.50417 Transcript_20546/m.50417 type:complete len:293 (+) Transcript_20546:431-1309(+)